jgi:hypothetical protein
MDKMMKALNNDIGALIDQAIMPQPQRSVVDTFAPIANELNSPNTQAAAFYLLSILHNGRQSELTGEDYDGLVSALSEVEAIITGNAEDATSAGIKSVLKFSKYNSTITETAKELQNSLTQAYTEQQPEVMQVFDATLATAAKGVPFAGPAIGELITGGIAKGIAKAVSDGVAAIPQGPMDSLGDQISSAAKQVSSRIPVTGDQVGSLISKGTKLAGDKAGESIGKLAQEKLLENDNMIAAPKTFGLGLLWYGFMRIRYKLENSRIDAMLSDPTRQNVIFTDQSFAGRICSAINPITRNQVAFQHSVARDALGSIDVTQFSLGTINTKSKSIKDTVKKLQEINKLLEDFFDKLIDLNILRCFAKEIERYKLLFASQAAVPADYKVGSAINERILALIIVSFFYAQVSFQKNKSSAALQTEWKGIGQKPAHLQTFDKLLEANKSLDLWRQVKDKSSASIKLIKTAVTHDLASPFKQASNVSDALKLYYTCAIMLTDNISRKEVGETSRWTKATTKTKTDYPDEAIATLQSLGYLTKYTTWTGIVTDSDKLKFTSGFTKLRYYGGIKGASASEKMMVFVFCLMVVNIVDPVQICCGMQDYNLIQEWLEQIIIQINTNEKSL